MSYAWVVGGGILQRPLVEAYRKRGMNVIVSDRNVNCSCSDLASIYPISTTDIAGHLRFLEWTEAPSAVMTAGTDVGPTVSIIANACGLPGAPFYIAKRIANKLVLRETLSDEHPWFTDSLNPRSYPCVVKPADSSASRGVTLCVDETQLLRAIEFAIKASSDGHFLIEECLKGPVAAADYFVVDGNVIYVNGAIRTFSDEVFGLETGYCNPWQEPVVDTLAQRIATTFGLREGPFKIDVINDERYGWTVLEAATRWSGAFDHTVAAQLSTGRDLTEILVDYSLGETPFIVQNYPRIPVFVRTPSLPPHENTEDYATRFSLQLGIIATRSTRPITPTAQTVSNRPLFVFAESKESLDAAEKEVLR